MIMSNSLLKKSNVFNSIIYVLLIITIAYNSGSAMMTINSRIGILLIVISLMLLLIKTLKINTTIKINLLNLVYFMFVLISLISFAINLNYNHVDSLIKYWMILTFSYIFVKYIGFEKYIEVFVKVMKIIVVSSLIPFFLFTFLNVNIYKVLPTLTNINGVEYYVGILVNSYKNAYDFRNIGLFWEPSIYSTYIIFALIFEITFKGEKPKISNIIIFTIGLLTTQSSGGIVLLFSLILLLLFKKGKTIRNLFSYIIILLLLLFVYINFNKIISYASDIFPRIFLQLSLGMESRSIYSRVGSIGSNIELFLQRPIFGWGLGNFDIQFSNYGISQTSTSTYFLGVFGIFGILYTVFLIVGIYRMSEITVFEKATIIVVMLLAVNKESHFWLLNTYIMLFYLLKGKNVGSKFNRSVSNAS